MNNNEKYVCRAAELLAKDIAGSLSAQESAELEAWCNESEENAALRAKFTKEHLLSQIDSIEAIDTTRPRDDMQARIGNERRQRRRWLSRVAAIAAVVCLVIGGNYIVSTVKKSATHQPVATNAIHHGQVKATLTLGSGQTVALGSKERIIQSEGTTISKSDGCGLTYAATQKSKQSAEFNDLVIPRGGEFSVVLSDGTFVWLNSESKLHYPVNFGPERIVWLEGEAYFKVSKDPSRPFKVITKGQTVSVLGTEFNVSAYQSDGIVYTTLLEGEVSVAAEGSDCLVNLTPNMQSALDLASEQINVKMVDVAEVASWRTGMFVFEGQTLDQIMRKLARWYDFDFDYAAGIDVRNIIFCGRVPRYGDFNYVLSILEKSGGIKFDVDERQVTVSGLSF